MISRSLLFSAVALFTVTAFDHAPAVWRGPPQMLAALDDETRDWVQALRNKFGGGCCDTADGFPVEVDGWDMGGTVDDTSGMTQWEASNASEQPRSRLRQPSLTLHLLGLSRRFFLRPTAHVDCGAVSARDFGIHPAQHQHPAVEDDDLAILLAGRRTLRTDIGLAAGRALQAQFTRLGVIRQVHHDPAGRAEVDHIRVVALGFGGGLGAHPVAFLVIRRKAPAPRNLPRLERGRKRRQDGGFRRRRRSLLLKAMLR
jgi:hypothetical protein